jgi:hypothetical protein
VLKPGFADVSSILVGLSASPVVDVKVKLLYFTSSRVALEGITVDGNSDYNWTVQSSAAEVLDTSDKSTFLTGMSNRIFVFCPDTPTGSRMFLAGRSYRVALTVLQNTKSGFAWLDISIPMPPTSGECSVYPLQGLPLETEFTITCVDWQGSSLPLFYSFSSQSALSLYLSDSSVTWSPLTSSETFKTLLPEGNFSFLAKIVDAMEYNTVVSTAVVSVYSDKGSTVDSQRMTFIFSQYDGLSRSSQSLMLADSVATNLNSAPGSVCTSNSCRRLLGSSKSYRMNIRLVLLKALSGSVAASLSRRTAPSMLKTIKRITVPSELSTDALDMVKQQIAAFNVLGLKSLQSGGLVDVLQLSSSIISSAISKMDSQSFDSFSLQITEEIMKICQKYWSGMVLNEIPVALFANSLSMDIVQTALISDKPDSVFISYPSFSNNMSRRAMPSLPVGYGVLKLNSGHMSKKTSEPATAGTMDDSNIISVAVWDPQWDQTTSGLKWSCPFKNKPCIQIGFTFMGQLNDDSEITCLLWSGSTWGSSKCTMYAVNSQEQQNIQVNCSCSTSGIFKAVLIQGGMSNDQLASVTPMIIFNSHLVLQWAAITIIVVFLFLIATSCPLLSWILLKVSIMKESIPRELIIGSWFNKLLDCDNHPTQSVFADLYWRSASEKAIKASTREISGQLVYAGELSMFSQELYLESVPPCIMFLED